MVAMLNVPGLSSNLPAVSSPGMSQVLNSEAGSDDFLGNVLLNTSRRRAAVTSQLLTISSLVRIAFPRGVRLVQVV
jgi:hypothetical protein